MGDVSRREFILATAVPMIAAAKRPKRSALHVTVVGAGAFGGWTALHLQRSGAKVTLVDAWGAGNSRASSGGETRVIRNLYGGDPDYIRWVERSFVLWRQMKPQLYFRTGALWMFPGNDAYARKSLPLVKSPVDQLSPAEAAKRFPQVNFSGINTVYFEHEAGYVLARRGCQVVQQAFVEAGGTFRLEAVAAPVDIARMAKEADVVVFACGPWLGKMFPDVIGNFVAPSRQEVFFFGTAAGDRRFVDFPVWVDFGERIFYGVPGNESRGFKIADDTRGEPVDPTTLERTPSPDGLARARQKLAQRFPALADAPLTESRVCQYENSPDGNYIIDRHPAASNVFLVGGGSGHGYKLGPALGEYVTSVILGRRDLMERFRLARLENRKEKPKTQMEHA